MAAQWYVNRFSGDVMYKHQRPGQGWWLHLELNKAPTEWRVNTGAAPEEVVSEVLCRDGMFHTPSPGERLDWALGGGGSDIVAYRIKSDELHIQFVAPDEESAGALGTQIGGSHYKDMAVQPWQAIDAWFTGEQRIGYYVGTALAYLARLNATGEGKGGLQDVKKAHHTLTKLIEDWEGGKL